MSNVGDKQLSLFIYGCWCWKMNSHLFKCLFICKQRATVKSWRLREHEFQRVSVWGYTVMQLREFCIVGSLQLLCCRFWFCMGTDNRTITNLEVQIWACQNFEVVLNSEIQKLELVNTQHFCTNSVSNVVIENLKVFRTVHRIVLILFPTCRC